MNIIVPYVAATRKSLGVGDKHVTLFINHFRDHKGDKMESVLSKN